MANKNREYSDILGDLSDWYKNNGYNLDNSYYLWHIQSVKENLNKLTDLFLRYNGLTNLSQLDRFDETYNIGNAKANFHGFLTHVKNAKRLFYDKEFNALKASFIIGEEYKDSQQRYDVPDPSASTTAPIIAYGNLADQALELKLSYDEAQRIMHYDSKGQNYEQILSNKMRNYINSIRKFKIINIIFREKHYYFIHLILFTDKVFCSKDLSSENCLYIIILILT